LEASPVDLLAPLPGTDRMVPATPNRLVMATQLRAWCDRQFESLRYLLEEEGQHVAHADFDVEAYMVDALKDGRLTVEGIDDILRFMREARKRMVRDGHWGTDGQD
ncbi:MAG TPA: hypothetical protein VG253_10260, partial [Streptosporangiaceae bacterium]|nr:hypothetical protein [Streptosporangiaceae bacterium]